MKLPLPPPLWLCPLLAPRTRIYRWVNTHCFCNSTTSSIACTLLSLFLSLFIFLAACSAMAACVDKWNPAYSSCRLSLSIHRFMPDCVMDCPVSVNGNGNGGCCDSGDDEVWDEMRAEAQADAEEEPLLGMYYADLVLSRPSLESALAAHLAAKLCIPGALPQDALRDLLAGALVAHPEAVRDTRADLLAARDRDPACAKMVHCFLYYKGFLALQAHRAAHALWSEGRAPAALLLQSRASELREGGGASWERRPERKGEERRAEEEEGEGKKDGPDMWDPLPAQLFFHMCCQRGSFR